MARACSTVSTIEHVSFKRPMVVSGEVQKGRGDRFRGPLVREMSTLRTVLYAMAYTIWTEAVMVVSPGVMGVGAPAALSGLAMS